MRNASGAQKSSLPLYMLSPRGEYPPSGIGSGVRVSTSFPKIPRLVYMVKIRLDGQLSQEYWLVSVFKLAYVGGSCKQELAYER